MGVLFFARTGVKVNYLITTAAVGGILLIHHVVSPHPVLVCVRMMLFFCFPDFLFERISWLVLFPNEGFALQPQRSAFIIVVLPWKGRTRAFPAP